MWWKQGAPPIPRRRRRRRCRRRRRLRPIFFLLMRDAALRHTRAKAHHRVARTKPSQAKPRDVRERGLERSNDVYCGRDKAVFRMRRATVFVTLGDDRASDLADFREPRSRLLSPAPIGSRGRRSRYRSSATGSSRGRAKDRLRRPRAR